MALFANKNNRRKREKEFRRILLPLYISLSAVVIDQYCSES
jgi:hypothetical protein